MYYLGMEEFQGVLFSPPVIMTLIPWVREPVQGTLPVSKYLPNSEHIQDLRK